MHMHMHMHMYAHTKTHTHIHTNTHTHTHTHTESRISRGTCAVLPMLWCTYTRARTHTHTHTRVRAHGLVLSISLSFFFVYLERNTFCVDDVAVLHKLTCARSRAFLSLSLCDTHINTNAHSHFVRHTHRHTHICAHTHTHTHTHTHAPRSYVCHASFVTVTFSYFLKTGVFVPPLHPDVPPQFRRLAFPQCKTPPFLPGTPLHISNNPYIFWQIFSGKKGFSLKRKPSEKRGISFPERKTFFSLRN